MRPAPLTLPHISTVHFERFKRVRQKTLDLVSGFSPEDLCAQSMQDASPAKWHLGHSSWFFEAMILSRQDGYQPVDPRFQQIFNSYYEALGERVERSSRGLITRPGLSEVMGYRREIDRRMSARLAQPLSELEGYLFDLGLNHEEQHQELLVQDLLHLFSCNPLNPKAWRHEPRTAPLGQPKGGRVAFSAGLVEIGAAEGDFAFDNERPRQRVWLDDYELDADMVTNGEWLRFIAAGGYEDPSLWLSDGWACVKANNWTAPSYWRERDGKWRVFTLTGEVDVDQSAPVRHISYYEADAFARWSGARLPTEAEWENAAQKAKARFSNLDTEVWQWTASDYAPYRGFEPTAGVASEYNGKFMANQRVLRGGSFATPREHIRISYRNFYYLYQRWSFCGLRLAHDTKTDKETFCKPFEVS